MCEGHDCEFDVGGVRVAVYEDNGVAIGILYSQPVDTQVAARTYWVLATLIARAVNTNVAYVTINNDLVDASDVVIHDSIRHPNDVKPEHIRMASEPEYVTPGWKFGAVGRVYETKHGDIGSPEYTSWQAMNNRCYNPKCFAYDSYGGRGITVCSEWRINTGGNYENFFRDTGRKPGPEYSIDRIDVDGPYSKENCRWASKSEQSRNRRNTLMLTFNGETKPMLQWAEEIGMSPHTLRSRVYSGMTAEQALMKPLNEKQSRRRW